MGIGMGTQTETFGMAECQARLAERRPPLHAPSDAVVRKKTWPVPTPIPTPYPGQRHSKRC
jgi:hypothetical protein